MPSSAQVTGRERTQLRIETPVAPPTWALLERELIRANNPACEEFFNYYFDERGYIRATPRGLATMVPTMPLRTWRIWPVLHVLGGD